MTRSDTYSRPLVLLHWLVFVAAALAVAAIEIKGFFPKGSPERAQMAVWHESFGLAVLLLMTLRLAVRASTGVPPLPPGPRWMETSARAMHWLLYLLMLAMPVLGVLAVAWSGKPVPFFGASWMLPLTVDAPLGRSLKNIHEAGANLVFAAVGLHAAAALWHQFVLKDGLLRRMS
ncbi:cytochrome b [Comamonas terrae]|uniref:Cytochrome b n=1 Tax=Comamonas terrae TaxID=673548 RepID=A0ABW5UTM0_9BURK|nr:cytochrome b [Comamonas terrae]